MRKSRPDSLLINPQRRHAFICGADSYQLPVSSQDLKTCTAWRQKEKKSNQQKIEEKYKRKRESGFWNTKLKTDWNTARYGALWEREGNWICEDILRGKGKITRIYLLTSERQTCSNCNKDDQAFERLLNRDRMMERRRDQQASSPINNYKSS